MNAFVAMCEAIGSWHVSTHTPNSHLERCVVAVTSCCLDSVLVHAIFIMHHLPLICLDIP